MDLDGLLVMVLGLAWLNKSCLLVFCGASGRLGVTGLCRLWPWFQVCALGLCYYGLGFEMAMVLLS